MFVDSGASSDFVNLENLPAQSLHGAHRVELRTCVHMGECACVCL